MTTTATATSEYPSHIRKSIRDTQRMLARPNLPATVRQQQERKLRALQLAVEGKAALERQQKMATKYRMVRFFESKKAARHLRQALRSEDEAAIQEALKDALYVQFFPKDQKYISMFPSAPCVDEEVLAKRSEMRESIFEAHAGEFQSHESIQLLAAKPASNTRASTTSEEDEDDDEDDEDEDEEDEDEDDDQDDSENDDSEGVSDEDDDSDDDDDEDDEFDDSDDDDEFSSDSIDDSDNSDSEDDSDEDSEDWSDDDDDISGDEDDDEDDDDSDAGSSRKKSRV